MLDRRVDCVNTFSTESKPVWECDRFLRISVRVYQIPTESDKSFKLLGSTEKLQAGVSYAMVFTM